MTNDSNAQSSRIPYFFDDDEERITKALEKVILEHLPLDKANDPELITINQAHFMVSQIERAERSYRVWNQEDEEEKIYQIIEGIRDAHSALVRLHPKIRLSIFKRYFSRIEDLENVPWHPTIDYGDGDKIAHPDKIFTFLRMAFIPAMKDILPEVTTGKRPGRNQWYAIAAIDQIRNVWEFRNQRRAPKQLNAAGPLAKFCRDVFQVLKIDMEPTSAFNAWRRTVKDVDS